MSKPRRGIQLAIALMLIGGVGSLITFFAAERHEIRQSATVAAASLAAVDVRLDNGKIELLPSEDEDLHAELSGTERKEASVKLQVKEEDGTLRIGTATAARMVVDLLSGVRQLRLTVYVPDKMQVKVHSNNGSIRMDHVDADIAGTVDNGSITVLAEDLDRSLDLRSNNGNIRIETENRPANAAFDLRAVNGKINVFGSRDWKPAVGNGDQTIKLRTNNGNILIEE
ncbi:DUF4097 domain-containing protein [Cohnella lubricantis]|uniref:DUF4097 family beta strand repeat protein n=1 Tax=Cohnella lubricantis TaxID=2163172 RepID=A0A841TD35_9BACL|nr:DUF4097 family beta strand repeat-containing protein [Cohnella lubricantis]MBB6679373.1 DUF4097 family beta strand repeat protein [Cohnella lubricantis]MBP2117455.1 hypothetical protein [Cohnella lubricantis]